MGYTPYFIGPLKVGLERDMDSYLIPEDAFPELENAYLWRGRVYKKGGYELLGGFGSSRYAGRIGIRDDYLANRIAPPQNYAANTIYAPIEPGSLIISDGVESFVDNGLGVLVHSTGVGNGTINYGTGAYNVTFTLANPGAAVTAVYFVVVGNNSPVMGLRTYDVEETIVPILVAFDLTSAYQFNRTTLRFDHARFYKGTRNVVTWTGNNTDFFHSTSYQSALFATNNVPGAHFYTVTNVTVAANAQITIGANSLVAGDYVFLSYVDAGAPNLMVNRAGTVTVAGNPITVSFSTAGSGAYIAGGVLWALTNQETGSGDGIRWYDGFTSPGAPPGTASTGWVNFQPPLTPLRDQNNAINRVPTMLLGALMLFPYKNYLLALNTVEGTTYASRDRFPQRVRWSNYGNVYFTSALLPSGYVVASGGAISGEEWSDGTPGRGGFLDAPTAEDIISAEFIKDTLIVYFENSTYKLTYTGNGLEPFLWEKINATIGAISTFSAIPFDTSVLTVGNNGIYACDSVSIDRIDRIIPDEAFQFRTTTGAAKRVQGIRDYYSESVLWTYVDNAAATIVFPTKTLYYNYITQSFAIFKNTFTCFGYFTTSTDLTWDAAQEIWDYFGRSWDSFVSESGFPIVVSGNQQGFVFQMEQTDGTLFIGNDQSLVIQAVTAAATSVFTSPNHNLQIGDFIYIQRINNGVTYNGVYEVETVPTVNTFTLIDDFGNPVSILDYVFGGQIIIIDQFDITTKNLNPFYNQGKSMRLGYVDFYFENNNSQAEITVQLIQDDVPGTDTVSIEKEISLYQPSNLSNTKFWRRVHFDAQGEFLRFKLSFSESQIFETENAWSTVLLHGMILWMKPTGRMLRVYD